MATLKQAFNSGFKRGINAKKKNTKNVVRKKVSTASVSSFTYSEPKTNRNKVLLRSDGVFCNVYKMPFSNQAEAKEAFYEVYSNY